MLMIVPPVLGRGRPRLTTGPVLLPLCAVRFPVLGGLIRLLVRLCSRQGPSAPKFFYDLVLFGVPWRFLPPRPPGPGPCNGNGAPDALAGTLLIVRAVLNA